MSKLRTVIALDVGGTNTRCALIDEKYNIIKVIRERTNRGSVDGFLNQIRKIITSLNARKYNPLGIICGVPGKVEANGYIPILPNIHIENIPLKEYLEKYFSLPIIVRNDAEIAAVAEGYLGSGKAAKSTYFITISTWLQNPRISLQFPRGLADVTLKITALKILIKKSDTRSYATKITSLNLKKLQVAMV